MIPWLIANWRVVLAALALGGSFYGGWHTKASMDASEEHKALEAALERAKAAEAQIVDFNNQLASIPHDKDPCYNAPIPASLVRLLK